VGDASKGLQLTMGGGDLCSSNTRVAIIQFPYARVLVPYLSSDDAHAADVTRRKIPERRSMGTRSSRRAVGP
jgi:hypothetical protein